MGTWHMPNSKTQKKKLSNKLEKLRRLEIEITGLLGDDIVLDGLEIAIERIEKFCTYVTMKCVHPAKHYLEDGTQVEGWCKLCREKAAEEEAS